MTSASVQPAKAPPPPKPATLARQAAWVVRLRWLAGGIAVIGGIVDYYQHIYNHPMAIMAVGAVILACNIFFRATLGLIRGRAGLALVGAQILADMICLALLVGWTGGYASPLRGFFVFHMVFASLLLPRAMAFASAAVAIFLVEGMLLATNREMPGLHAAGIGAGWGITLFATVYLATRITGDLRRKRRRLARQTKRLEKLTRQLRAQQHALAHQEKIVALGQMAAGVAHEIGNPLASMDGLLQLMERRPEKVSTESFARLRDQVARINQIVRQLTTFARPGEQDGGPWAVGNLNDVVARALEVLRFDQRLKRVALEKVPAENLPPIRMQSAALEQVVINLVINACDAMEQTGSPKLEVRTLAIDGAVELAIVDNGPGIPTELKERVFEPFFSTKAVGKGTGLGLPISASIVRKHGGEISHISLPGRTEMRVRLPLP